MDMYQKRKARKEMKNNENKEEMPTPKNSLKELERERKKLEIKEQKKLDEIK